MLPQAALFSFAVDGVQDSVLVLGPLITFSLPVVAMIAFWWEDWPGSYVRYQWSGLFNLALIAVGGVLLAMLGQVIVGHFDFVGIFDPTGHDDAPLYPASLSLAGAAFTAILQLTLVSEGWPLRSLPRFIAGFVALVICWGVALLVYFLLVDFPAPPGTGLTDRSGPLAGDQVGSLLVLIAAWQVWLFIVWRGWPFTDGRKRWVRIISGNITVVAGGVLCYLISYGLGGVSPATIKSAGGCFIAAALIIGMLFEGAFRSQWGQTRERVVTFVSTLLVAVILYSALLGIANLFDWTKTTNQDWVTLASLNAVSLSVILHVAVARRWPFGDPTVTEK